MVQLSTVLTLLTTSALLVSATSHGHRAPGHRRLAKVSRSSKFDGRNVTPANSSFDLKVERNYAHGHGRVKKRAGGDGKVCRIKTAAATSTASQSSTQSQVTSSASSTVTSSAAPTTTAIESSESSAAPTSTSEAWTSSTEAEPSSTQQSSSAVPVPTGGGGGGGGHITPGSTTPNGKKAGIAGGDSFPWVQVS